jgi:hypothetical protein
VSVCPSVCPSSGPVAGRHMTDRWRPPSRMRPGQLAEKSREVCMPNSYCCCGRRSRPSVAPSRPSARPLGRRRSLLGRKQKLFVALLIGRSPRPRAPALDERLPPTRSISRPPAPLLIGGALRPSQNRLARPSARSAVRETGDGYRSPRRAVVREHLRRGSKRLVMFCLLNCNRLTPRVRRRSH